MDAQCTSIRTTDAVGHRTEAGTGQIHLSDKSDAVVQVDQIGVVGWKETSGAAVANLVASNRLRNYRTFRVAEDRPCAAWLTRMGRVGQGGGVPKSLVLIKLKAN